MSFWPLDIFESIDRKLDQVIKQNARIISQLSKAEGTAMGLKEDVDRLVEEVEENTSVAASVEALLAQTTELLTNLKSQVADPAAQAKIQEAINTLDANNKRITDAVTANTPAESG